MTGLVPFNRRNNNFARVGSGFEDFYNMIDDFFSDGVAPGRNLLRDTFKMDIEDRENEYLIEAELPGVSREEIEINVEDSNLCILINRAQESDKGGKSYVHRERRVSSMRRRVRLQGAKLDEITAKLQDGVLFITIPKDIKANTARKIAIE